MSPKQRFELVYAPQVKQHLGAIGRKYYALIREEIEAQLLFEPEVETRNRKPLKRLVDWGLRGNCVLGQAIGFESSMRLTARLALSTFWRSGRRNGNGCASVERK